MSADFDVVVVGSGINSLVCAAETAKRGLKVCVLERNAEIGGCIRSDELTLPGFVHDTLSGFHPLFVTSPAFAALREDLEDAGLEYRNNATPTGALMPDGTFAILSTSRARNERAFDELCPGDGAAFSAQMRVCDDFSKLVFGLLGGEIWSLPTLRLLITEAWRHTPRGLVGFFGESLQSSRQWLDSSFQGEALKALLAPWILHTGLGPDSVLSGFMNRLIAFTLEAAGMPVVAGGAGRFANAFQLVIERHGGEVLAGADVTRIDVARGRAIGVSLRDGRRITAGRAVVCNVTPTQLYLSLLQLQDVPAAIQRAARAYRYGRGDMQIHIALAEPPRWTQSALCEVVMVHITGGVEAVATAVSEAERSLLPASPTIVVGQPSVVDVSRAPGNGAVLWLQLQELPRKVRGDAAGLIAAPSGGLWNDEIKEKFADRVLALLRPHIENIDTALLARRVLSPVDLEALNINLVGGDPYSGACTLDQSFLWRPLSLTIRHETHIKNLYHIGASTHPGPGLGGISGHLVAKIL